MAKKDPEVREQLLQDAEALLTAKYGEGRGWIEPVRVMRTVRAAADAHRFDDAESAEVPAADVLAALTQLAEARAALDTLERDLTRAARRRGASWSDVADHLGLAGRTSAESRFVRLERDAASLHRDRYPERLRAERARDRAGDAWSRASERRLREALGGLSTFNDTWPELARTATSQMLSTWVRDLDGPGLAARLRILRVVLSRPVPDGAVASHPTPADELRLSALALLDEHVDARLSADLPAPRTDE
ncbi:hypothetical protein [Streptomyces rubiginosohelvolus]|uniref:Uncharacterized protein n=1 Tax=Streptomyces rubiginosohelvolus TaxID=67362 RepID=A0ABQ3CDN2_9ACTN|nr:hypothetical protein [Streptomyces pluricolorescens]GGZ84002.1 hypothetical protein GCM10010328_67630 [Streptomyces pluricolorescens]